MKHRAKASPASVVMHAAGKLYTFTMLRASMKHRATVITRGEGGGARCAREGAARRARADGPASAVPQESKSAAAISMRLIMCLCARHGRGHQGRACHDIARGSGNLLTISGNLARERTDCHRRGLEPGLAGGRARVQHEEWSAGAPTRAVHVRWGEGACARALPLGSPSLRCLLMCGLFQQKSLSTKKKRRAKKTPQGE